MPGRGRGYVAWQRDIIGHGQESVALIAYDAEGMAEAVGTMYEMVAGIQPLTPWRMPVANSVAAATAAPGLLPALRAAWQVVLPDRVDGMKAEGKRLAVLTHDGSLSIVGADGKLVSQKAAKSAEPVPPAADAAAEEIAKKKCPADRIVKLVAANADAIAVAHWGGTLIVYDKAGEAKSRQQLPQDATALAWLGDTLAVGLADGRVVGLAAK